MNETILIIIAAVIIVALYFTYTKLRPSSLGGDHHDHHHDNEGGNNNVCCGRHTVCDKGYDNSYLYFEDEELDRFRGKKEHEYTEDEVEEFRNILYTMKEEEVDQWVKCLGTRGIALPLQLKEDIFLILQ